MNNNYANMLISDSPHGGRSPIVSRQDSSGTLKTTISLGKTPTIIQTGPFYTMREPPGKGELTGDKDLMTEYGLDHTLTKFKDKKVKESLASFLPNLPGINDNLGTLENSTLLSIIEKPPICGKELVPLTSVQLAGFRLHPGPLPEQYRAQNATPARKHKNKHKKNKAKDGVAPQETSLGIDSAGLETYEKKHKKQKRHEDDKERKKRKKEKKRKKKSHSPDPQSNLGGNGGGLSAGSLSLGGVIGSTLSGLGLGVAGGGGSNASSLSGGISLSGLPGTPNLQQQQTPQQQLLMQQQLPTLGSASLGAQQNQSTQQQMLQNQLQMGGGNSGSGGGGILSGLTGMSVGLGSGMGSNNGSSGSGGLLSSTPGLSALLGTSNSLSSSGNNSGGGGGGGGLSGMLTNNGNNSSGSSAGTGGLMMSQQQMSLF